MIESYKDLIVWQKSMALAEIVYHISTLLPRSEIYGLVSQVRRSVVSIPSNIAEGYKRRSSGDYMRFLTIADGSAAELETQLLLTQKLYPRADISRATEQLTEVQKMLTALIKKLKAK